MRELTWRPLVPADAKASADLLNAIETVDRIGENYTEEDTLQELIDPYADLERASLAAFDGEALVGYVKVRHKAEAEAVHRVFLDGGVHPAYRRRGIGTALVDAGVAAAEVVHARHHPALRLVVDVHKAEHIAGVPELVRSRGFAPVRYFQRMEHALSEVTGVAVPGLRIEGWTAAADEEFRAVRNDAYRDFWGAAPMPADQWRNKIVNQTFQPEVSFLARDGGTAVGVLVTMSWAADTAATGVRDAHFMVIGTAREHRRRGVASALLGHALATAAGLGYDRASLSVDSADPAGASGIFAKAGFVPKHRYVRWAREV
ncbi:GNAT family N-acetyltransferase [Amycolatopsis solani]|uniref:GNAT family N-acetyltransferase n=1 Tax=Amycolatopsis solani TaxID=3028615 RepID=UPI0025B1FA01|nr:GNAT family N-acetyltransferase [Amycolatopsis sp. MEP2-6]